jgi:hypothetical protein
VSPRADLDAVEKRKILTLQGELARSFENFDSFHVGYLTRLSVRALQALTTECRSVGGMRKAGIHSKNNTETMKLEAGYSPT